MWPMPGDWPWSFVALRSSCAPPKSDPNSFVGESSFYDAGFVRRYPIGDHVHERPW